MNQQHRFIFWGVLMIVVLLSVSSITFPIFVAQTVKNQNVICIDAGHGGSDPGKVGYSNVLEKDINLSLALKLQKLLERKNFKVYMTRNGDYNLADSKENEKRSDLSNRKQLIFENDPMAVISIHQNSYPSSDVHLHFVRAKLQRFLLKMGRSKVLRHIQELFTMQKLLS